MNIQLLNINKGGNATYRVDGRLYQHKMAISKEMVMQANPEFNGSFCDAKIKTHIEPTISKFHKLKTRFL